MKKFLDPFLNTVLILTTVFLASGGWDYNGKHYGTYTGDVVTISIAILLFCRFAFSAKLSELAFTQSLTRVTQFKNGRVEIKNALDVFIFTAAVWMLICFILGPWARHWHFGTYLWDLGVWENAVFRGSQTGRFDSFLLMNQATEPIRYFPNNHIDFSVPFFGLVYKILPRIEVALLGQSLALLAAMIPLYRLGDRHLKGIFPVWLLPVAYWFFDSVHRTNLWDYHGSVYIVLGSLWALERLDAGKEKQAMFWIFFTGLGRADGWLVAAGLSFYYGVKTKKWMIAIPLGIASLAVLPIYTAFFNQVNSVGDRYGHLGRTMGELISNVAANPIRLFSAFELPENQRFLLEVFWRTGGALFLFGGWVLVPFAIPFFEIALSNHPGMVSWTNHYSVQFAGPLFVAVLFGWKRVYHYLEKRKPGWGRSAVVLSFGVMLTQLSVLETANVRGYFRHQPRLDCFREIVNSIPPGAGILTHDPFITQFPTHMNIAKAAGPKAWFPWATVLITEKKEEVDAFGPWNTVEEKCDGVYVARR